MRRTHTKELYILLEKLDGTEKEIIFGRNQAEEARHTFEELVQSRTVKWATYNFREVVWVNGQVDAYYDVTEICGVQMCADGLYEEW